MRRLVDHWWLLGSALLVAVIALTVALYAGESDRHDQQQRATEHQAVASLSASVDDVLAREVALARVVGTLPGPVQARWPVLSNIVMSQTLANSTAFIQPVSERARTTFEARTGLRLVESPKPGLIRVAARRLLHLVVTAYRRIGSGQAPLGIDLAANPLRRALLLEAARTGQQLATPPVEFLTRKQPTRGVVAYVAVRGRGGRLIGNMTMLYTDETPDRGNAVRNAGSGAAH
jgi:hypothetical protein